MALTQDLVDRIRRIFLHDRPHRSILTARHLLGWSRGQMKAALDRGEIGTVITPLGRWVGRAELVAKALDQWPLDAIREALGDHAAAVLPVAIRIARPFAKPLPRRARIIPASR